MNIIDNTDFLLGDDLRSSIEGEAGRSERIKSAKTQIKIKDYQKQIKKLEIRQKREKQPNKQFDIHKKIMDIKELIKD